MLQVTSTTISLSDSHKVKKMRSRLKSGLRGLLSGGLWSGIVSAILFGLRAYFGDSSSTLGGEDRNWTGLFMVFGLAFGVVVGAILGAILGALQVDKRTGIIIGIGLGLVLALVLSSVSLAPLVFAVIVSCVLLRWLKVSTLQARDQPGGKNF